MTRITIWLAATVVVVALLTYYQINLSGEDERAHGPATAECGTARPQAATTQTTDSVTPPSEPAAPVGGEKSGDPCASGDHTGKPGESK
jgi:hypothetical protein